ncbi:hypothetical protein [Nocardioides gansuensis]|uniref:hypothetical protein n=1 Tax=Nocardioides gansuensis TaxID=2138300 RepID=UPI001403D2D7|nr:hypothetical protein [Nocardioides gansuensis]
MLFSARVTGGTLGTTEVGGTTDHAQWLHLDEVARLPRVGLVDAALSAWGAARPR